MSFIGKSLFSRIIARMFGQYIKDSDEQATEASILTGDFSRKDIEFKENVMLQHKLPLKIVQGSIKNIDMKLNYKNKNENSKLLINDLKIKLQLITDAQEYQIKTLLHHVLHSFSNNEIGNLSKFIQKLMRNLEVSFNNIHIQLQMENSNEILEITIPSITIQKSSENNNVDLVNKEIKITDISVVLETQDSEQKIILDKFSLLGKINIDKNTRKETVCFDVESIDIFISEFQWSFFKNLRKNLRLLSNKIQLLFTEDAENEFLSWYQYSYKYISNDAKRLFFEPQKALKILKKRKDILRIIEKRDEEALKVILKQYNFVQILNLLNKVTNQKRSEQEFSEEEDVCLMHSFIVNFNVQNVNFIFTHENTPLMQVSLSNISSVLVLDENKIDYKFEIERNKITTFPQADVTYYTCEGKITGAYKVNTMSLESNFEFNIPQPKFVSDFTFLSKLNRFFHLLDAQKAIADNTVIQISMDSLNYKFNSHFSTLKLENFHTSFNGISPGKPSTITLVKNQATKILSNSEDFDWEFNINKETFSAIRKLLYLLQNNITITNVAIKVNSLKLNLTDTEGPKYSIILNDIDVTRQFSLKATSIKLFDIQSNETLLESQYVVMIPSKYLYYLFQFKLPLKCIIKAENVKFFRDFLEESSQVIQEVKWRIESKEINADFVLNNQKIGSVKLQPSSFEITHKGEYTINAYKPEITINNNIVLSSNFPFYFQYYKHQIDTFCRNLSLPIHWPTIDIINNFLDAAIGKTKSNSGPICFSLFKINLNFEKLVLSFLNNTSKNNIFAEISKFSAKSEGDMSTIVTTFQDMAIKLDNATNIFHIPTSSKLFIHLVLSSKPPKNHKHPELKRSYFNEDEEIYLHAIESTLECSSASYTFTQTGDSELQDLLAQFYQTFVTKQNGYNIHLRLSLNILNGKAKIPGLCNIEFKDLLYDNTNGYSISFGSLTMLSDKEAQKLPDVLLEFVEPGTEALCIEINRETLKVNVIGMTVFFDFNFFSQLSRIFFVSPFVRFGRSIMSDIIYYVIEFKNSKIRVPISTKSEQTYLLNIGSFLFEQVSEKFSIELQRSSFGVAATYKDDPKMLITNNFSLSLLMTPGKVELDLLNADFNLTTVDIASFFVFADTVQSYKYIFKMMFNKFYSIDNMWVSDWHVQIDLLKLNLYFSTLMNETHHIPFGRLFFTQCQLDFNFNTMAKSEMKFTLSNAQIYNILTNLWDTAIDPFSILLKVDPPVKAFDLIVTDVITTALSFPSTSQVVSFFDDVFNRVKSKNLVLLPSIPVEVVNHTGEPVSISVHKNTNFTLNPMQTRPVSATNKTEIRVAHSGRVTSLTMSQLLYPLYIRKNIVAYRETSLTKMLVVISNSVLFVNETKLDLAVAKKLPNHKRELLLKLRYNELTPLPSSVAPEDRITVLDIENIEHGKRLPRFEWPKLIRLESQIVKVPYGKGEHVPIYFKVENIQRLVKVIHLKYNLVIFNELPENISVLLENSTEKVEIDSDDKKGFCAEFAINFKVKVFLNRTQNYGKIHIVNKSQTVPLNIGQYQFAASIQYSKDGKFNVTIFSPAIVYKMTEKNFYITDAGHKEKINFEKINDKDGIYFSDKEFFQNHDKKSILLYPFFEDINNTHKYPIECVGMNDSQFYLMPLDEYKVNFMPMKYTLQTKGHSRIITFYDALYLENNLPFDVVISPHESDDQEHSITIESMGSKILSFSSVNWTYLLRKSDSPIATTLILQNPTTTNFLLLHDGEFSKVYFEVTKMDNSMKVVLNMSTLPHSPIVIMNETDYKLYAFQEGHEALQTFKPGSTSVFAYNSPFGVSNITVSLYEDHVTLPMSAVNDITQFHNVFIEQIMAPNGSRIIKISKDLDTEHSKPFSLSLIIESLSYSIIDDRFREMALLNLRGINLGLVRREEETDFIIKVKALELDDMHPAALFEVALIGHGQDEFFNAKFVMKNNTKRFTSFKSISVKTGVLEIYCDVAFLSDFVQVIRKLLIKPLKLTKTKKSLITCESFELMPMMIDFNLEPQTARPMERPPIDMLKTAIPVPTSARIQIDGIMLENLVSTSDFIIQNILMQMFSSFKLRLIKVLFSVDVLFNIGGISANIARQKETDQSTSKIVGSTALRIGESITSAAGKLAHCSTAQSTVQGSSGQNRIGVNQTAGETVASGFKSFGASLIDGPAGLIMDPVRGAKKDGFGGFVKGVGTGITGLIMHPISGVIDVTTSLIMAGRKAVESNSDVHKRVRCERALIFRRVSPYNEQVSLMQNLISKSDVSNGSLTEQIEVLIATDPLIVCTEKRIYESKISSKGKLKIANSMKISSFVNCASIDSELRLDTADKKTFKYQCDSEYSATQCVAFLRSVIDPTHADWI